jgi:hypothetical protein
MLEAAAAKIEATLRDSAIVITYDLVEGQLSPHTGYIEGSANLPTTNNHPEITTFPHHKHLPDGLLLESTAPDFAEVFAEVESYALGIF